MSSFTSEFTVALDELDDHLKAILKVKLREFVHLSPWFSNIILTDVSRQPRQGVVGNDNDYRRVRCPNRHYRLPVRRRVLRSVLY